MQIRGKFRRLKFVILIILILFVLFLAIKLIHIFNADLLASTHTSSFIGKGSTLFYVINSKNGRKTSIPSFLLPLVKYDPEQEEQHDETWKETIRELDPEFVYNTYTSGWLDKENIIFTSLSQDGSMVLNLYKYNIKSNQHILLLSDDHMMSCVGGNGKIFYSRISVLSGRAEDFRESVYRYSLESGETSEIAEYKTGIRNFRLLKVLK